MSRDESSWENVAQRPNDAVRRSVVSLFAAQCFTFLVVGLSYLVYSRLLTPAEFGIYSTALAISTFGQLLMDGGLRNTIIKARTPPTAQEQSALLLLMGSGSLLLSALLWMAAPAAQHSFAAYPFLAAFAVIYLLSFPFTLFSTSYLERRFAYRSVAWIESTGTLVERGLPAVLLLWPGLGLWAFVWCLLAGRALRIVLFTVFEPLRLGIPAPADVRSSLGYLKEGLLLQLANGSSLVRDSLHVVLVGPLFGQAWVGYYGWSLQLSRIASQAFVGTSARVSVPVFAQSRGFGDSWRHCLKQIKLLTMVTGPLLIAALVILPSVNAQLFHSHWTPALTILPLLFLRMLPLMATTPVGTLVMVGRGGGVYARASFYWTLVEVGLAALLTLALGPFALAWSYGVLAWVGLFILVRELTEESPWPLMRDLVAALLWRASLGVALVMGVLLAGVLSALGALVRTPFLLLAAPTAVVVLSAYVSEHELRRHLRYKRNREKSQAPSAPLR